MAGELWHTDNVIHLLGYIIKVVLVHLMLKTLPKLSPIGHSQLVFFAFCFFPTA